MNALKGEAVLDAGGESYTLVFDINALCEAEDALAMDVDQLLARYASGTSTRIVRALVWAALQAKHPCTLDTAGEIISRAGFLPAKAALEKALTLAMPMPDPDKPSKKAGGSRAGTG